MDEGEAKKYLDITLDIMNEIAQEFYPKKLELNEKIKTPLELSLELQKEFNSLLANHEAQLIEKYDLSFSEYNEVIRYYSTYIEKNLLNDNHIKEKYFQIQKMLKIDFY